MARNSEENLNWKKVITIKCTDGSELEVESYNNSIVFIDIESGRTFSLFGTDFTCFIELITEL